MTNEMMEKARECKSADELLALAKENGIEMSADEAAQKYAQLHNEGELSDDELDSAAGGGCGGKDENTKPKISDGDAVKINDASLLEWGGVGSSCVCCSSSFKISNVSERNKITYGKMTCMCCAKLYAFRTEHPYDGEAFTKFT